MKPLRILRLTIGAIIASAFVMPLGAQTADWDYDLRQTRLMDISADRISKVEALLESADSDERTMRATLELAKLYLAEDRPGAAINVLEPLLGLQDAKIIGSRNAKNTTLFYLKRAYQDSRLLYNYLDLVDQYELDHTERLGDVMREDYFTYTHRYTPLVCPKVLFGIGRVTLNVGSGMGERVTCKYVDETKKIRNRMSVVILQQRPAKFSQDTLARHKSLLFATGWDKLDETSRLIENAQIDIRSESGDPAYMSRVALWSPKSDHGYAEIWSYPYQEYEILVMLNWPETMGAEAGRPMAMMILETIHEETSKRLDLCRNGFGRPIWQNDIYTPSDEALLSMLANTQTLPPRPDHECLASGFDGGNHFISRHPTGARIFTIDGSLAHGDIAVIALGQTADSVPQRGKLLPHMLIQKAEGMDGLPPQLKLIARFDYRPSVQVTYETYKDYLDGNIEPIGVIKWDADQPVIQTTMSLQ